MLSPTRAGPFGISPSKIFQGIEMSLKLLKGNSTFSYTAFEQWIKKEIKVRECCVFIKKMDGELEPICHCGNVRSAHSEGIQIHGETEKWDKTTHTTLTECSAYGKINFLDEDTTIQPEYIRVASDYGDRKNIQRMEKLLREFWGCKQPGLLISVIGGNKSFHAPHDVCLHFQHGLLNAAKSTNGWIITSGQDEGVTKLVGDIIGRSILTSKIYTIGVANWGKTWNKEMLLRKNNRFNESITDYTTSIPELGSASLEPNHSHFFLVDDGTTQASGVEIKFRGELEFLITKMYEKDGVPLPMICIMLEGGSQSIEMALNSLRMGQPLVVIKGSGRAADIVCTACEMTSFKEDFIDGEFVVRGVINEEGKRDISDMLEACFSKFTENSMIEKLLKSVVEIASFKKQITVYKIDGSEPLDFAILSSLMKSIGESAARMRQLKLAITWGHEKVAKELIFEKKDYKFRPDELNSLLMFSIINRRVGFIRLLLDYGADLKNFLTAPSLTKLYNILPKNSGAFKLLTRFDRAVSLRDVGELMERIMEGTFHSFLTQEKYNQDMREDDRFDNPYDLMMLYSALIDAPDMAKFFWENSRTPIATSLIVHKIFLFLDKMESQWARVDEEMTEKLETSAREFEKLACGLMTICYHNYDKPDWIQILIVPLKEWGGLNLFDLATIIEAKNFIAHAAYQSYLTDLWMGQLKPTINAGRLFVCLVPPLPIFLPYNKLPMTKKDLARKILRGQEITTRARKRVNEDVEFASATGANDSDDGDSVRSPDLKEKLYYFYTSPVIKFYLNSLTYLAFLLLYGYGLLVDDKSLVISQNGSRLEWQDLYTIVFVLSTVPVEINQIRNGRTKSNLKKVVDHFADTYNLMDFIAVCMFMVAFALKASTPYYCSSSKLAEGDSNDCTIGSSMNLNHFGSYQYCNLLSALAFGIFNFGLMKKLQFNPNIGPKIVTVGKMAIDLLFFMFLLAVFTIAYGVSSQALLYPFRETSVGEVIFELMGRSYLNVFGEIDLDGFDEHLKTGHCRAWDSTIFDSEIAKPSECTAKSLLHTEVGRVNYYVAFTLLSLYLLFVNIMLINLLIAIFSNTYENVETQSGIIYKTQRAEMILEFRERPPLPNPVSLLYFLFKTSKFVYRRYIKKINYEKDLQKMISSMPNRHSSMAYRSSLMEAECRAQFIRQNKSDSGDRMISHTMTNESTGTDSSHYLDLSAKINRLEGQLTVATENISKISDLLKQRVQGKTKRDSTTSADQVKPRRPGSPQSVFKEILERVRAKRNSYDEAFNELSEEEEEKEPTLATWGSLVTHSQALTTPYPGTDIERFKLEKGQIAWKSNFDYTPPVYDNEEIPQLDPKKPNELRFNHVDSDGVDRISFIGKYTVHEGFPRNPKGRTGLIGKGNLPRWGPNKLAVTIVTRYKEQPGSSDSGEVPGGVINKQGQPVVEVLLLKMEGSPHYMFPQGFLAPSETVKHAHQRVVLDLCYDFCNQTKIAQIPIAASIDPIFSQYKELSSSYMDDPMNTDNSWMEVSAATVHDNQNAMSSDFKLGSGVIQIVWFTVTERPDLHPNMVTLLRKTLTVLKSYSPYTAAEEAESGLSG
ncbi:transient receptor potential cation channel subfamily M member-like 2 isoform X5 [Bolinopsis microptera]|uniref:transient receptor potential cation channel subfamily M member-like 2 isoform X5 n=1 Tax=Bolinopsis microptera TaxID=2820187 RepID=UPI00307A0E3E